MGNIKSIQLLGRNEEKEQTSPENQTDNMAEGQTTVAEITRGSNMQQRTSDSTELQASALETTQERSNNQYQLEHTAVTNVSLQNTNPARASRARSYAISRSNSEDEDRRGRRRERHARSERLMLTPDGKPWNKFLLKAADRLPQQRGRSKRSSRNRHERSSSPLGSRRRSLSLDGFQQSAAIRKAVQGSFNVIPSSTNLQTADTSTTMTQGRPKTVDKGKERTIEKDLNAETGLVRSRSLDSLDLQTGQSKTHNKTTKLSKGPSDPGSSDSSCSSNNGQGLSRRHSSATLSSDDRPKDYLREARQNLLDSIAHISYSARPKANLKNYPFATETAQAVLGYASMEDNCAKLTEELARSEDEKDSITRRYSASEDNVAQLQRALENEIEEKEELITKTRRSRTAVEDKGTQTDDLAINRTEETASRHASSKGAQTTTIRGTQTEAEVVAGIFDKYKDRLAAAATRARSGSSSERRINWSRIAPRCWGGQSSRIRRSEFPDAEGSEIGGPGSANDGNVDGQSGARSSVADPPRLKRFTFEMHEQHVAACKAEAERVKAGKLRGALN